MTATLTAPSATWSIANFLDNMDEAHVDIISPAKRDGKRVVHLQLSHRNGRESFYIENPGRSKRAMNKMLSRVFASAGFFFIDNASWVTAHQESW